MNKRGQMYILAAVLLCIAIYGIMKVSNRLEMPAETNFDFYVENFQGERSYVVDYGFLSGDERIVSDNGLLDIFTKFGSGIGIVYAEYKNNVWIVTNYLGQDIETSCESEEEECKEISIPSGDVKIADLLFDIGKKYYIKKESLDELPGVELPAKYFTKTFTTDTIKIKISGNDYNLESEGKDKIESIIFQNIDKNYVRVVKV